MHRTQLQCAPGRDFGILELCTDILVEQKAFSHGVIVFWVQVHTNETIL